jgi:hypothetical protein
VTLASSAAVASAYRPLYVLPAALNIGANGSAVKWMKLTGVLNTAAATAGDPVYLSTAGGLALTAGAYARVVGRVLYAHATLGEVWIEPDAEGYCADTGLRYTQTVVSTSVANVNVDTMFDKNFSIPANTLKAGSVIRVRAMVLVSAVNAADNLILYVRLGGLTGTAVLTTAGVVVAANDVGWLDTVITLRTATTLVAASSWNLGVPGTATTKAHILGSTAVDPTIANVLCVTAKWSAASANNACRLDVLAIDIQQ